jgi:citrate lyase subunit beta/citryl-CoA lyase
MRRSKLSENPSLRLAWLFGAGANAANHDEMTVSGAQVLIQDLEDFTPPPLRPAARLASQSLFERWRAAPALVCVRINSLDSEGLVDLAAVLPLRPDIIAYPKADGAAIIRTLDQRIADHERALGLEPGRIEILPVCETALGVVTVRKWLRPARACAVPCSAPRTWPPIWRPNAVRTPSSWTMHAGASCSSAAQPASSRWMRPTPGVTWRAP